MNNTQVLQPEIFHALQQEWITQAERERRANEANPVAFHVALAGKVVAAARRIGARCVQERCGLRGAGLGSERGVHPKPRLSADRWRLLLPVRPLRREPTQNLATNR